MRIAIPVKTVSLLNQREHWRVSAKRKAEHRFTTKLMLHGFDAPELPVEVTFTRIAPGALDAHDNLPSAFKHVCDEVAAWLGVDDSDKRVIWKYAQQKGKRGEYGVVLEVQPCQE